jgi:FkbM family methyltransferase
MKKFCFLLILTNLASFYFIFSLSNLLLNGKNNIYEQIKLIRSIKKDDFFYSQMGEDLILAIVFNDRLHKNGGFYVDVGANNPSINNNTRFFYERNWRGINFEPIPHLFEEIKRSRPEDININAAVSVVTGKATFFEVEDKNIYSSLEPKIAREYSEKTKSYEVETTTLNKVFEKHHLRNITFLSIDVEGAEKDVLESIDLQIYRPEIILIESLDPINQRNSHDKWEEILLKSSYDYAYFDGLNRYYVRRESSELTERFKLADLILENYRKLQAR